MPRLRPQETGALAFLLPGHELNRGSTPRPWAFRQLLHECSSITAATAGQTRPATAFLWSAAEPVAQMMNDHQFDCAGK